MSKKILFQFPGQGSQAVGMGTSLADAHPEARAVFDEVNAALGEDLFAMMKDGPEEDLRLTRNAQPALFAASMAAFAVLREATGRDITEMASFVAGHSLGEYSALAAAGSLSITDAAGFFAFGATACRARFRQETAPWRRSSVPKKPLSMTSSPKPARRCDPVRE